MDGERSTNVAVVPSPGMGHLIPLIEFAKRLVHRHSVSVTFLVPADGSPTKAQESVLDSLPPGISHVFLPPVDVSDIHKGAGAETRISLTVTRSVPALRDIFERLAGENRSPAALVVDLFGTDAFDAAVGFNIPPYIFFPSTANVLSFFLYLPKLDQMVSCEYRDLAEPVKVPGCMAFPGKELLDPVQDRKRDAYRYLLHNAGRYKLAHGIMVNSFAELETQAIKALLQPGPDKPPVYPVGPLVNVGSSNNQVEGSECLKWLDEQPLGSVLFVSFGSGGTLSRNQMNELALGLELSEQRFIWVIRSPNDTANSSFFSVHSQNDPTGFLPAGFLDRTKNRGLVLPSWAPQAKILSHVATGGFLTHCGWNSTLESVVNGVALVAWPLYAEQRMNAIMLTDEIKVALRPRPRDDGVIEKGEIGRVVKALMEGEEGKVVRNRMKELKEAARRALSDDGSSTKALADVVRKWTSHKSRT